MVPTSFYNAEPDYRIANESKGIIYMGSQHTHFLGKRLKDLDTFKEESSYLGRICRPEIRGEQWSLAKNAAFFAGGIDAQREFLLVTPLNAYACSETNRKKNQLTVSQIELCWLRENNYTFKKDSDNPEYTWCLPPKKQQKNLITTLVEFSEGLKVIHEITDSLNKTRTNQIKSSRLDRGIGTEAPTAKKQKLSNVTETNLQDLDSGMIVDIPFVFDVKSAFFRKIEETSNSAIASEKEMALVLNRTYALTKGSGNC